MAAIDLRAVTLPTTYRATSIGTTWKGFLLPPRCLVTLTAVGEAGRVAFAANGAPGATEAPADGGAVGTHYDILAADAPTPVRMSPATGSAPSVSVFVARSSTSGEVVLRVEALP